MTGLYVGGSLATGDYRPGVSDIDGVAILETRPRRRLRAELATIHRRLARDVDEGAALHCVYVSDHEAAAVTRTHWTWASGKFFRRPLSGISRAELLADPVVVFGPAPSSWLHSMTGTALREAARAELAGYWGRALRRRGSWLQDVYVDLGLTTWARADATISDGVLITKAEAIARMAERGVPAVLVDGVARRRGGQQVSLTDDERAQRAEVVARSSRTSSPDS